MDKGESWKEKKFLSLTGDKNSFRARILALSRFFTISFEITSREHLATKAKKIQCVEQREHGEYFVS